MENSEVSDATRRAEDEDADSPHQADRPATPEEEEAAGDRKVSADVRAHEHEMAQRGADEKGEGRIS